MKKHWIAGAIEHKGSLRQALHVPAGHNIPKGMLEKVASGHGINAKRARLAITLGKMK